MDYTGVISKFLYAKIGDNGYNHDSVPNLAKEINEEICRIRNIKNSLASFNEKLEELKVDYEKEVKNIQEQIKKIRSLCKHEQEYERYHSDPSGGQDSYHECGICGRYK